MSFSLAHIDIRTDGIVATPELVSLIATMPFNPSVWNESHSWLHGVSAGLVYYSDGDGSELARRLQADLNVIPSPAVEVAGKQKLKMGGNSFSMPVTRPLLVQHTVLQVASSDLAPLSSAKLQGGTVRIPRPIGKPVRWRAALYVTVDGGVAWFQLEVQSGANNDQRKHPLRCERVQDQVPTVAYQFLEYHAETNDVRWMPGVEHPDMTTRVR